MMKKFYRRLLPVLLAVIMVISAMPIGMFASATSVSVLDGQVSISDTANTIKVTDGVATATIKGTIFGTKTNTLTITSNSESSSELKFDYEAKDSSAFTIDSGSAATSGTFSKILEYGDSITLKITSNKNSTATLTLKNFSLVAAAESSDVTFEYDSTYGSITVGGNTVTSETTVEGVTLEEGTALVATAKNGGTFHGWINANTNEIISTSASYTLKPSKNMTIKAVFIGANSEPHFMLGIASQKTDNIGIDLGGLGTTSKRYYYTVNGTYIVKGFNAAMNYSASSNYKVAVLMNNCTLTGEHTVPAGVTLLIPFDSANTMLTTSGLSTSTYTTPTAYRTLTMANGAKLTVNGAISLSAKHLQTNGAKYNGGSPTGAVGFIKMEEGSNITLNSGSAFYAYGFVTGKGSVTANSGSKLYENFQIMDFRGGDQSTQMKNGVFPVSQYYVQNIEVPLTLHKGATETSYTTVNMQGGNWEATVQFIAQSNAMFNLTDGYVTKWYDGATDRLMVEVNGAMNISGISIEMGLSDIDSKKYELPINNNITVKVNSGSTIALHHDIALLPGSKIIIDEGANCTLGSGNNIYVYDADVWGNYCGAVNQAVLPLTYAPGRTYTRTEADLVDAEILVNGTVDASAGYVYTTTGGANIHSDGTGVAKIQAGTQSVTYQITQKKPVSDSVYHEIPLTVAKLKNADGTYVEPITGTYNYGHEVWFAGNHEITTIIEQPTCTDKGYTKDICPCGYSHVYNEVAALQHDYTSVTVDATCDTDGYTEYTCTACGHSYKDNIVTASGHNYSSVVTPPTCADQGYTTHTCSKCGDSYVDGYVDTVEHSYGEWLVDTPADCLNEGLNYRVCSKCSSKETQIAPALGHSHNAVVTAPTCTDKGYTTYTCSCGDTYVADEVDALGHTAGAEPTCTENQVCTVCGTELAPKLGHSHEADVTKPTCTDKGYTTYTCYCGDTYVADEVDALGHSYSDDYTVDVEATHTTEGSKSRHCAHCDSTTDVTVIPVLCDIDGNGVVDTYELTMLRQHLLGTVDFDEATFKAFDMDNSGEINIIDLVMLKKYISTL